MAEEQKKAVAKKPESKRLNIFQRKALEKKEMRMGKRMIAEEKKRDSKITYTSPKDAYVSLQRIHKIYDNGYHAVHDFSIDIKQHEFIVFVGPSGCGKSTTLRMIAGLEDISAGALFIDGDYMNDVAPKDRGIAMVFQSYALYPHLTVYENMAYPLKIMHLSKAEIDKRIMDAANILQIEPLLDRKPKALSGGQRQRVALGRAIVRHAKVLLMDEPLSNLDAKLRVQMRSEIVSLHNKLGATTIYVTHDQTEAMTMASRIVVMKVGYVQQIGTPIEVFQHPYNLFVAGFIGSPSMNFYEADYNNGVLTLADGNKIALSAVQVKLHDEYYEKKENGDKARIAELTTLIAESKKDLANDPKMKELLDSVNEKIANLSKSLENPAALPEGEEEKQKAEIKRLIEDRKKLGYGIYDREEEKAKLEAEILTIEDIKKNNHQKVIMGLRPEDIHNGEGVNGGASLEVTVTMAELLGNEYYIHATFGGKDTVARFPSDSMIKTGDKVKLLLDLKKLHIFSTTTELCIF
jgi:multiple sugar transport system ATP-binding protein